MPGVHIIKDLGSSMRTKREKSHLLAQDRAQKESALPILSLIWASTLGD